MRESWASIEDALPEYQVERELGRGGMGVVYLGRHRPLDRVVAIKELPASFARDAGVRERFVTEARVLASLGHPHVVPVFDFVEQGNTCLLVMEALGGGTVWDRFTTAGLTMPQTCAIVLATCSGLEHAHASGVLHRDIKPENILFGLDDSLKVTDFGIAKVIGGARTMATVDGGVLGTPAYMAPEQAEGQPVGRTADVYATGTMLYELLSGSLPFPGTESPLSTLLSRVSGEAPDLTSVAPSVPPALASVAMRAIARQAADRYQSAEELGIALGQAAADTWGEDWLSSSGVVVQGSEPIGRAARTTTIGTSPIVPEALGQDPDGHEQITQREPTLLPTETVLADVGEHQAGFDQEDIVVEDLVEVQEVLRPPAFPWLLLVGSLLLMAGLAALAFAGSSQQPVQSDSFAGAEVAAQRLVGPTSIDLDLTEPIELSGLPEGDEVSVQLASFELPLITLGPEPIVDSAATIPASFARWISAGQLTATVEVATADGSTLSTDAAIATTNPWFLTAQAVLALIGLLIAVSLLESNLRVLRRGRKKIAALIGAALAGALLGAALALLLAAVTGNGGSLVTLGLCSALGALAAVLLGLARAQLGRRRRLERHAKRKA